MIREENGHNESVYLHKIFIRTHYLEYASLTSNYYLNYCFFFFLNVIYHDVMLLIKFTLEVLSQAK